jgi:hypothetical protein
LVFFRVLVCCTEQNLAALPPSAAMGLFRSRALATVRSENEVKVREGPFAKVQRPNASDPFFLSFFLSLSLSFSFSLSFSPSLSFYLSLSL